MNIEEIKKYFGFRYDKQIQSVFQVSTTTISNWRNKGIPLLWQRAIQLHSDNQLVTRDEDTKFCSEELK